MRLPGPSRRARTPSSRAGLATRGSILATTVAAAVLGAASPAAADATVSPATAEQGAGVNLTFTVTNDHPKAAITEVRLLMPPATPVAEVYPLSVPDWAPQTTLRTLNPPLRSIHGGAPVTATTAGILWTATAGRAIAPGGTADLMVAMGPLPESDRITFTLQPTYADGSTGPALPPVAMTLTAPVAVMEDPTGGDDFSDVLRQAEAGTSPWTYAGWIVALLIAVGAVVAVLRSGRACTPAADPRSEAGTSGDAAAAASAEVTTDGDETIAPERRVSAWSYRDGP